MSILKSTRIESIDILRGLVMVLMALDHVRDYFHINALMGNYPENLESTNLVLFGTRFITHYCAPVFVFLAGTSAFLYGKNKSKSELSKFLITRGIWLIFVEIAINNFLWWFDVSFSFFNLQVIWVIGLCMIFLGLLIFLPKKVLVVLGLVIVFGHNLLDGITRNGTALFDILWYITHQSNTVPFGDKFLISFTYPFLPWLGVIILGYCFGSLYNKTTLVSYRKKWLLIVGLACIILFFILRGTNIYGDLFPWTTQVSTSKTIISFFNVHKYPPSLSYLLITLGPSFLFLAFIEKTKNTVTDIFVVFGRVPFFYYIIHILFVHVGAIIGLIITGKDWKLMILDNETFNSSKLQDYGYSLFKVYLIWLLIVALLYPICKAYMTYKLKHKDKWWLSYL